MDHYAVLDIPIDANTETIHDAYRRLARKYHPDVGAGSSSEKFRTVTDAYRILSDPELRSAYDEQRKRAIRFRPEPLIPERVVCAPEPLRTGTYSSHFGPYEYSGDPFAVFDQLFEQMLRHVEDLLR